MTEAEELQAILSEPGKAVGKYFEGGNHIIYVFADTRVIPMETDDIPYLYLMATNPASELKAWRRWHEMLVSMQDGSINTCFARVRKADPNRNLNLIVGDTVELVNGDVVEFTLGRRHIYNISNGMLCTYDSDPYHAHQILKVITRAAKGGVMDSDVIKKLREDVDAISARVHELEGLA